MKQATIDRVEAAAYRVPTDSEEEDGTARWSATTLVTVHASGGGQRGFGYSYASPAAVTVIEDQLAHAVKGLDALAVNAAWEAMSREVRNVGRPGIAATAISAVDAALWDLKAKLLGVPLVRLLGAVRRGAPVYGSGGFTNLTLDALRGQLRGWVEQGIPAVKMKIGARPAEDLSRVRAAREAIGQRCQLMVDANGAYTRKQALEMAEAFEELGVCWFEEPVSSDDLEGLHLLRERAPAGMDIAAGEYGYDPHYFRRMLEESAVDVLQADATRCLGITGFLAASRLCEAFHVPLSAHTSPSLHRHVGCALKPLIHVEYFHDHARLEEALFEGFSPPREGMLVPDLKRPGLGVELNVEAARPYLWKGTRHGHQP